MSAKRPRSIPDGGSVEYRGFVLSRFAGTQMGHKTAAGLKASVGIGTRRKVTGVSAVDPDGYERVFDTLREALDRIDRHWDGV
jgi:hypothetical protein